MSEQCNCPVDYWESDGGFCWRCRARELENKLSAEQSRSKLRGDSLMSASERVREVVESRAMWAKLAEDHKADAQRRWDENARLREALEQIAATENPVLGAWGMRFIAREILQARQELDTIYRGKYCEHGHQEGNCEVCRKSIQERKKDGQTSRPERHADACARLGSEVTQGPEGRQRMEACGGVLAEGIQRRGGETPEIQPQASPNQVTQTDKHVCPNWKSVCTWCGAENPPAAWRASQAPTVSQTVSPEERARPILEYFASLPINTRILGEMIIKVIRDDRAAILHNGTQNGDVSAIYQASHALGCYIDKAEYQCCVPKCPSRQARPERKDGKCPSCGEHRADYPATSPKELTKSDNSGKGEA